MNKKNFNELFQALGEYYWYSEELGNFLHHEIRADYGVKKRELSEKIKKLIDGEKKTPKKA